MKTQELISKLENYSVEEIAKNYKEFNPEFFNGHYTIPSTTEGWAEQIIEDINENGYSLEDIM